MTEQGDSAPSDRGDQLPPDVASSNVMATTPGGHDLPTGPVGPWERVVRTHYEVRTDDGIVFSTSDREYRKDVARRLAQEWVGARRCTSGPYRVVEVTQTWWTSASEWSEPVDVETPAGRHDLIGQEGDDTVWCFNDGCRYSEKTS